MTPGGSEVEPGGSLVDSVRAGRPGAAAALRAELEARQGDTDRLAELLDPLALAAGSGSSAALEELVWAVDALALARPSIRRIVLDETDVDDIAQDVLIAVAETVSRYRGDAKFTTWLHQVSRFKSIAHLRRRHDGAALTDEPPGAARISSMVANRTALDDVICSLPTEYRGPVVLRDIEGLSYEEVARRLDLNLNTTRTRIARGRALVAARLR